METLKIYPTSINTRHIERTADAMRDGALVLFPTGGLYAIGCDALNRDAVQRLCRLRDIDPARSLMSIVCADISMASSYVRISNTDYKLLNRNLPGPFTFVLPAMTRLPKTFKNRRTVGVRIPDNAVAQALVAAVGNPLFCVGVDGDPETVALCDPADLALYHANDVDITLDAGEGTLDRTTVVDLTGDDGLEILRQGAGVLDE